MGFKSIILGVVTVALGVFYQTVFKQFLYINFGVGRVHNKLEEFPFACRRLVHPLLESCEDLVLDHEGRRLYAACSTITSRSGWSPGTLKDHVSVLNIDEPGDDGLYGLHQLEITGDYTGTDSHNSIDLHGFDIEFVSDSLLRFWMVNHRPPIDDLGNYLDATKLGANSTIEVFDHTPGSSDLHYVKTVLSAAVYTPNSIVATGDGGFVSTNDHSTKTGTFRSLDMLLGSGSIAVCNTHNDCHIGAEKGIRFPNGIAKDKNNRYYVASSVTGKITVHALYPNGTFSQLNKIDIGMPLDNLSVDANGDIYAAGFPDVVALVNGMNGAPDAGIPAAVFRVRGVRDGDGYGKMRYEVKKVLEDIDASVLPMTTTAVHDVKTGRLFLGGVLSSFMAVCEPRLLTRAGPLWAIAFITRPLEWLARKMRDYAMIIIAIWLVLAGFLLTMPALLLYSIVGLVAALPLGAVASATAWLCRAEEAREWKSLLMLVVGIGHLSARRISNACRYAVGAIGYPLQYLSGYLSLRRPWSIISKYTWPLINSRAADFVAERAVDVASLVYSVSNFLSRIIILVACGGVVAQESSLQQSYTEFMILVILLLLQMPLWFLGPVLGPFVGAYIQIKNNEIIKSMMSNSIIYNSLSLIRPVEEDIPKRRSILVRLLTLFPGDRTQPIKCSLSVVDLIGPDMEDYDALSYVWGPPDTSASIVINDQPFSVSYLLYQALVHLRDEKTPRVLWIDALCVNQNDLAERSSQVLFMHQIYSDAARVVVWLGGEEPWGLKQSISSIGSRGRDGDKPNVHFGITRVVSNLLSRPWWTRVWIVQEFILARNVQIQCGTRTMSWEQFCVLVNGSVNRSFFPKHLVFYDEFQSLRRARELRTSSVSNAKVNKTRDSKSGDPTDNQLHHATDLLSLIYNFRSRRATEPRDKVFAFLGLAEDNHGFTLLKPDYSRQISSLCIDLARQHIHHSHTLSVVALAECTRKTPQTPQSSTGNSGDYIPSWCPSFMSDDVYHRLQWRPLWTGLPTEESKFSATSYLSIHFMSSASSSPMSEASIVNAGEKFNNLNIQVLSNFKSTISDDCRLEGVDELVAQTKTNITWESVVPRWRILARKTVHTRMGLEDESGFEGDEVPVEELFHLTLTAGRFSAAPSGNDPREEEYLQTRRGICSNRRFFATRDGRIGIGPDDLKAGDEVHLALGMQVPMILRKAIDEREGEFLGWIYIGQAYIHDRMVYRGDLKNDIDSGKVGLEERNLI
ncbi:hypothetical protein ACMFMG_009498 [Clarireedia jacksonii]